MREACGILQRVTQVAGDLLPLRAFLELLRHDCYELDHAADRHLLELDRSIQELRDQMSRPNARPGTRIFP